MTAMWWKSELPVLALNGFLLELYWILINVEFQIAVHIQIECHDFLMEGERDLRCSNTNLDFIYPR